MRDHLSLGELASLAGGELRGDPAIEISDVSHDSRDAAPGLLFVAVRGFTVDGHDFVAGLEGRVAGAVVEDWVDADVPQVRVGDSRGVLGVLADAVHGHPSAQMAVIGVTGTNGKTTVTYLLESIVRASGRVAGRLGTTGASIAGREVSVPRTTPEASDLHRLFAEMVGAGVDVVALEVSSHALQLDRVAGVSFDVVAFTNLSQDHLDFHGDMETYFGVKSQLFDGRARREVIWVGDEHGRRLFERRRGAVSVGFDDATVRAAHVTAGLGTSSFTLETPGGSTGIQLPLGGAFNVANAAIAAACALAVDVDLDAVASGLEGLGVVPGRMEAVDTGQPFLVLVDYAHSPGGIEIVVRDASRLAEQRVIAVVGAGGDRDREKRPMMGAAAADADVVFVTSDNPRSEDPDVIIDEIIAGTEGGLARVERIPDRRAAIAAAVAEAKPGDVVLVLGKGHETGQDIGGTIHEFDDRQVVYEVLEAEGYRQ